MAFLSAYLPGFRIQSRLSFGSWIRNRIEIKIQKLKRLEIKPMERPGRSQWRSGGLKWSPAGSVDQWSKITITDEEQEQNTDTDPH